MITQSLKIQSMCILKAQNEPRVIGVSLATDCPLSCPQDVRYFWRALKWCVPHTWIAPHTQPSTTCHLTASCSQKTEIRRAFSNPNLSLGFLSWPLSVKAYRSQKAFWNFQPSLVSHIFCFLLLWPAHMTHGTPCFWVKSATPSASHRAEANTSLPSLFTPYPAFCWKKRWPGCLASN